MKSDQESNLEKGDQKMHERSLKMNFVNNFKVCVFLIFVPTHFREGASFRKFAKQNAFQFREFL